MVNHCKQHAWLALCTTGIIELHVPELFVPRLYDTASRSQAAHLLLFDRPVSELAVAASHPVVGVAHILVQQITACILLVAESCAFHSVVSITGTDSDPSVQLYCRCRSFLSEN